jgi:uncharacterized SAM-binding protein YcdF (DUF218 family)
MGRIVRSLGWCASAFTLVFLLLTCTPLESWWVQRLESAWPRDIPPVLLVLGADQQSPGLIGYSSYLRLYYAVRFWREGRVKTLVVSGGPQQAKTGGTLARAMRDYLVGSGIPPQAILMEEQADSTRDNFVLSRSLMESVPGARGFLTSEFHSGRAARTCARLGLDWVPVPIPDAGKRWNNWGQRWALGLDLTTETGKWIWYAWKGWI